MESQSTIVDQGLEVLNKGMELALVWLFSPAAWMQFALLVGAYFLVLILNRIITPKLSRLLLPEADSTTLLFKGRRFILMFLPLLLPLFACRFTAIGEQVTRSLFGSGAVIAFGKRFFLFLALRSFARNILTDPFLRRLGKFVVIPVGALYALGVFDPVMLGLSETGVSIGNINFSVLAQVRGIIAGSLLFWLGHWSNTQSVAYIERHRMRPAIRQLMTKVAEFAIFGFAFLLLMNIMGVDLGSLAVLGGAIGVGLGFGLQKIASNFISGVILLVEGQAAVGDYVELDGGEAGTIIKMTVRATFLETFDGRWIVVPNEDFITTRVVNYSDSGSANRLEAAFSVSYDTDINKVPVMQKLEPPDCELRGFGDNVIDDGKNKYTSDSLFVIWNTLKDNGIEILYPHRVIEIKGGLRK